MAPKGPKRFAPASQSSSKKRKLNNGKQKNVKPVTGKGKEREAEPKKIKLADRGIIAIPEYDDEDDLELDEEDMAALEEFGGAAGFLKNLDRNGIMRSKKETLRLHEATKPVRVPIKDDLPPIESDDDDAESFDSNIEGDFSEDDDILADGLSDDVLSETDNVSDGEDELNDELDSDEEMPYEKIPRKQRAQSEEPVEVQRLPIKLANGQFLQTGTKPLTTTIKEREKAQLQGSSSDDESEEPEPVKRNDIATGARFGRAAVTDVLQTKSRKHRIEMAKGQIAGICQEIIADPENSLGLLRRLHTFALKTVTTPENPEPVLNDPIIRKLAVLSELAIFKDIIPGYRIRTLTDAEKAEKVSQMVARTRDWEQGLVGIYQGYLRLLEQEQKLKTDLADVALECMCTLLTELTHFNFRVNLMACIVSRLSKKSWDKTSELCTKTLIDVFKADLTGEASLEIVRLINRMIKERHFKVHPNVLSCLLHLRLRTELGVRASSTHADKLEKKRLPRHMKQRKAEPVHLSKKAKKAYKEQKEIDKELREAGAEVDKEERKTIQTETLKLLFALYFRILKNPTPTPLLPPALTGISRFAHLVNIDFFKDLMTVLKHLISMEEEYVAESVADLESMSSEASNVFQQTIARQLLCITTAFELLSGQGEALNMDLSEFVTRLYAMLLPLSFSSEITDRSATYSSASTHPSSSSKSGQQSRKAGPSHTVDSKNKSGTPAPIVDSLFSALNLIFSPRSAGSGAAGSPIRAAAFAKRILTAALHWPAPCALRALDFVAGLVAKSSTHLVPLLSTEDRIHNGIYRPEVDDPQLCGPFETCFWELHALRERHYDTRVRLAADQLLRYSDQNA